MRSNISYPIKYMQKLKREPQSFHVACSFILISPNNVGNTVFRMSKTKLSQPKVEDTLVLHCHCRTQVL